MGEHFWHVIATLVVVAAPIAIIVAMQAYDRRVEGREKGVGPQPTPSRTL